MLHTAQSNMIKQQLRACRIVDDELLAVFQRFPRENFVPQAYQSLAYSDSPIPLGHDEVMSTPYDEAMILKCLRVQPGDKVLEVGTGSGYTTALLASMAEHVISIDIHNDFCEQAQAKLAKSGLHNVTIIAGDAAKGWPQHEPYDAIAITGSLPYLPDAYKQHLHVGGRLYAVVGEAPVMEAVCVIRTSQNEFKEQKLYETCVKRLINAKAPSSFIF